MIHPVDISTLDLAGLEPYRTLRQSEEQLRAGRFVAEGEKVVRRLLDSDLILLSVLMTPEWFAVYRGALTARTETIDAYIGERTLLEQIVGFHLHQGIMALARIPTLAGLEDVLHAAPPPRLLVALDGLANAENLGVVVRNCAAFGVHGILTGETSSSPYLRRAVRNSMGTVFRIPVVYLNSLAGTVRELESRGFVTVAAHPHTDKRTIDDISLLDDTLIVLGSEGHGISREVLDACRHHAAIPMQPGVDSLNVANAAAVFLYEVYRQRHRRRSMGGGS